MRQWYLLSLIMHANKSKQGPLHLRACESVPLEAHGLELAADLALLEGPGHPGDTALQAVLHTVYLLPNIMQLLCLHCS